jgi:hypothetical protein
MPLDAMPLDAMPLDAMPASNRRKRFSSLAESLVYNAAESV